MRPRRRRPKLRVRMVGPIPAGAAAPYVHPQGFGPGPGGLVARPVQLDGGRVERVVLPEPEEPESDMGLEGKVRPPVPGQGPGIEELVQPHVLLAAFLHGEVDPVVPGLPHAHDVEVEGGDLGGDGPRVGDDRPLRGGDGEEQSDVLVQQVGEGVVVPPERVDPRVVQPWVVNDGGEGTAGAESTHGRHRRSRSVAATARLDLLSRDLRTGTDPRSGDGSLRARWGPPTGCGGGSGGPFCSPWNSSIS
jgi:hypothetical protein